MGSQHVNASMPYQQTNNLPAAYDLARAAKLIAGTATQGDYSQPTATYSPDAYADSVGKLYNSWIAQGPPPPSQQKGHSAVAFLTEALKSKGKSNTYNRYQSSRSAPTPVNNTRRNNAWRSAV